MLKSHLQGIISICIKGSIPFQNLEQPRDIKSVSPLISTGWHCAAKFANNQTSVLIWQPFLKRTRLFAADDNLFRRFLFQIYNQPVIKVKFGIGYKFFLNNKLPVCPEKKLRRKPVFNFFQKFRSIQIPAFRLLL